MFFIFELVNSKMFEFLRFQSFASFHCSNEQLSSIGSDDMASVTAAWDAVRDLYPFP